MVKIVKVDVANNAINRRMGTKHNQADGSFQNIFSAHTVSICYYVWNSW